MLTIAGAEEDSNARDDFDLTSDITIEMASGTATFDRNQLDWPNSYRDVTVGIATSDGTANAGSDYSWKDKVYSDGRRRNLLLTARDTSSLRRNDKASLDEQNLVFPAILARQASDSY